ncbi:hypothetical protein EDB80DRAFT_733957 [Ilyonectria destructans]|nr:hypothetical protein EDB80DRAFT_740583 [Ilyonectria destructans]KAH6983941.1 hypothetical protein EDB80DRAFT_733957 [Ilyonectria destructans]
MTAAGFLDIIYVTDDFETAACFEFGQTYFLEYRKLSTPGLNPGISLTQGGSHYAWIREASRPLVEDVLQAGKLVFCRPECYGKRWKKMDWRLGIERQWQDGIVFFWQDNEVMISSDVDNHTSCNR